MRYPMKIRRLEIQGFKSFADRTVLRFGEGITGVVGPNGCGKSNIVDAIRWVMGEQSAKHLRGAGMQDVIFAGSDARGPLGLAEVTISFKNDGNLVPPQYSKLDEISVTRRLFRDGTSEYAINRVNCRLRDILDLFMGTGIGKNAYSIIEQGRIGLIVTAKPEDRRAIIEDAAGVSRYKARRKQAERRIASTEQNLLRITDITDELEERLKNLEKQAKQAERYKSIKGDLKNLDLHGASHEYLALSARESFEAAKLTACRAQVAEDEGGIAEDEATIAESQADYDKSAAALREREIAAAERQQQLALTSNNIEFLGRERTKLGERCAEAGTEEALLTEELETLVSERDAATSLGDSLQENGGAELTALDEGELRHKEVTVGLETAQKTLEAEKQMMVKSMTTIAEHKSNLTSLERAGGDLEQQIVRAVDLKKAAGSRLRDAESHAKAAKKTLEDNRQLKLTLENERETQEHLLTDLKSQQVEAENTLLEAREELISKRHRLKTLLEIQKNYEGCTEAVRAMMQQREEGTDLGASVHGLLADVLASEPRFEAAIEAILGERLEAVVVNSQADGAASVQYLKDGEIGRSSFIPLDLREDHVAWAPRIAPTADGVMPEALDLWPDLEDEGVCGKMVDLVRAQPGYEHVARVLLGDVVVVENLEKARSIWQSNGHLKTLVTLSGEVLDPVGVLSGGSSEGKHAGMLAQKREIKELTKSTHGLGAKVEFAEEEHNILKKRVEEAQETLEKIADTRHKEELSIVNLERDVHRFQEEGKREDQDVRDRTDEIQVLRSRQASLDKESGDSQDSVVELENRRVEAESKVAEQAELVGALRSELDQLNERLTDLKVQAAANREKRDSSRRHLERIVQRLKDVEIRLAKLAKLVKGADAEIKSLGGRIKQAETDAAAMEIAIEAERLELDELRKNLELHAQSIKEDESKVRETRSRIDEGKQSANAAAMKVHEHQLRREKLSEQVDERYRVQLANIVVEYHALPPLSPEDTAQIKKLRKALSAIGAINLTAIEEFETVKERFDFLMGQKNDLLGAIEALRSAIRRINKTSRERYVEAFRLVNEKFQQIFPKLFAGGRCALVLTDESDPLESGIEVLAQPPGKKLQSVNLLSGGEKALTAVALIFGIFLIKPTPFCLLDEVDAPLDEANVGRYNELLREMSAISQFILITHNKRTMELPDRLYGVTMEDPGVSKIVPVDVRAERSTDLAANA